MSSQKKYMIRLRDFYLREEAYTHKHQLSLVHQQREEDQHFVVNQEPLNGTLNLMKYPVVELLRVVNYGPITGYFDIGHEMCNSERVEFYNLGEIKGELKHSRGPGTENILFFDCRQTFLPTTYPVKDPHGFYESLGHIVNSLGLSQIPARLTAKGEASEEKTESPNAAGSSSKNNTSSLRRSSLASAIKVGHRSLMTVMTSS